MLVRRYALGIAFVCLLSLEAHGAADALVPGDGDMLVRAHCSGCHSLKLVTAQRGDKAYWLETIRWMQRTQKLWQIPTEQEVVILDYLATHYSESDWGRRPPLPPSQLPD